MKNKDTNDDSKVDWSKVGGYLSSIGTKLVELSVLGNIPQLDDFERMISDVEKNNDTNTNNYKMDEQTIETLQNSSNMFDYIKYINFQIEHNLSAV